MIEVRTPFGTSAVELSGGGLYRKQILKFGTINYRDRHGRERRITFDRRYGEDLVRAFQSGAYEQVPFQLADADNRHTNDPTRTAGEVVRVELSKDGTGVDGILRLSDKGREVVLTNPKLGVSARILENAELGGRVFPRALQHVLGTVDPQVRGMRPWEKVDSVDLAAGTVSEALDLSTETYEGSVSMGDTRTVELAAPLADLLQRPGTADRLARLLEEDEAVEGLLDVLPDDLLDDDEDGDDDEDDSDEDGDEDGDVNLSYVTEAVELSAAQLASQDERIIELTARLNHTRTEGEVAEYARKGLSPAILDLARPLLAVEPGAIELSNGIPGDEVDPASVVRELLDAVVELSSSGHLMVDPDEERGSLRGDTGQSERDALLADWSNYG